MPAESSTYWNSTDSRRSTFDSFESGASGRHYIDPWDLENYAYLRRHSVTDISHRTQECSFRDARARSEYWYALSSMRKSEYDDSPYTQELYYGSVRPTNNSYYQQTIYEDERMGYATSFPVNTPALDFLCKKEEIHYIDKNKYLVETVPSPLSHVGHLNTYGHLKIDYTNSWNSLNRRISK